MNGVLSKRIPEADNFDFSLEQFYLSSEELLNHCLENKTMPSDLESQTESHISKQ